MNSQFFSLSLGLSNGPFGGLIDHADFSNPYILLIWQFGGVFLFVIAVIMVVAFFVHRRTWRVDSAAYFEPRPLFEGRYGPFDSPARTTPYFHFSEPARHEVELRATRELLHATLECLNSPAAILDDRGNPVDGNDAWWRFVDTVVWPDTGRKIVPHREAGGAVNERRDCVFDAFRNLFESARRSFKICYFREIDRRKRVFEFSATRIQSQGAPHILVIHQDITEKEIAASKLKELSRRASDIQEAERQRIAREIHDSTSQHLVAINLNLMNLRREMIGSPKAQRLLEDIERSASDAQQEIRLFSYLLYPSQLERAGAKVTIEHYVAGFSRRAGIGVKLDVCDEVDALDVEAQQSLLRVIQEALINVHRHAKATSALVKVSPSASGLFAMIVDDGVGMKGGSLSEANASLGVGIPGMMSRVQELGGSFNVVTSIKGTSVVIEIPWQKSEEPELAERGLLN